MVPNKELICYQRRLPRVGCFVVNLESWVIGIGVAREAPEAGAVCHSSLCLLHLVQCLGAQTNIHRNKGGRQRGGGYPWGPSLYGLEGCSRGTGHGRACITHGTTGFNSPSSERPYPELLGVHTPCPSPPGPHTSGCQRVQVPLGSS